MKKVSKINSKRLKDIRVVDLFAGIGGFHLAFEKYGAKVVYASEWDEKASAVYYNNFKLKPDGDITKIEASSIPEHDVLCSGFPCQPFSISGNRLGFEDSRGTLFFDVARIVKEKKPRLVFMENVKNFESHDNGRTLDVVRRTMEELGYTFFSKVLDASDYGVPQSRKRIYMLAFRSDLNITSFDFPDAIPLKKRVNDLLISDELTSKYIIQRSDVTMKDTKEYRSTKPLRLGTINKGGQGERIYSPLGTAITLSAYGGGVGSKTGIYMVNGKMRKLAPRECARLTGFPDTYKIASNDNDAYKQFGNSVVVDVLQYIIEEIIKKGGVF